MAERRLGIIMNGVTGRMGSNQHLVHSMLAIRDQGGLPLSDGSRVLPEPLLVGRSAQRLRAVAERCGVDRWTVDLDGALADPDYPVYFDSVATLFRARNLRRAIAAGKHVYCEKPSADSLDGALEVYRLARDAGVRHGVVQDKLWAPGLLKLWRVVESGFLGRVVSVRIEGCYWVFDGEWQPPQRPSWNYRKSDGGSMILDMFPHYRYMLETLFARVVRLTCIAATQIKTRWDESGKAYEATGDDTAFATLELEGGILAQINSSWCFRVRRDDIITVQADGTHGSAVAGLRRCFIQSREATPRAQWSLDVAEPIDFLADWQEVPDNEPYVNAFRAQWELFLRHLCEDAPFPWTLEEGAKGVQLAELAFRSWAEGRRLEVPELDA